MSKSVRPSHEEQRKILKEAFCILLKKKPPSVLLVFLFFSYFTGGVFSHHVLN